MPRRMSYVVAVDKPAAAVYRDFTNIGYWEDLVAFYRENSVRTEIERFSTDASGTDIAFTHIISAQDLPAIARPVVPASFAITRQQHFDPLDEAAGRAAGHYRAEVPVAPVEISGDYVLSDTAGGSQLELRTLCRAKVPLIGGQIEYLVVNGLRTLFSTEGEFTTEWVAGHH